jgi:hypothetical protein
MGGIATSVIFSQAKGSRRRPQSKEKASDFNMLSKWGISGSSVLEALARSDAKYAIADRFDEAKGEYVGLKLAQLVTIDLKLGHGASLD